MCQNAVKVAYVGYFLFTVTFSQAVVFLLSWRVIFWWCGHRAVFFCDGWASRRACAYIMSCQ